eukprot:349615-Chlamydomonas_euryale.AAC.1
MSHGLGGLAEATGAGVAVPCRPPAKRAHHQQQRLAWDLACKVERKAGKERAAHARLVVSVGVQRPARCGDAVGECGHGSGNRRRAGGAAGRRACSACGAAAQRVHHSEHAAGGRVVFPAVAIAIDIALVFVLIFVVVVVATRVDL